jgi:rubrerythrin
MLEVFEAEVDPCTNQPIGDTSDNLTNALVGVTFDSEEMYPGMITVAAEEQLDDIEHWMDLIRTANARVAIKLQSVQKDLDALISA